MLTAVAYALVRSLRDHDAMLVVFSFAGLSSLVALPLMLPTAVWPTGAEWWLLLASGVTGFAAQTLLTMGLQRERAGPATAMGYLQIVFAAFWGTVVFSDIPGPWTLAGAAIVVGCSLLMSRVHPQRPAPTAWSSRGVRDSAMLQPTEDHLDRHLKNRCGSSEWPRWELTREAMTGNGLGGLMDEPTEQVQESVASAATQPAKAEIDLEKLKGQVASGANWFFWIAGLSLVNSVVFLVGGSWSFIVGLGITQLVDAVVVAATANGGPAAVILRFVAFGLDVVVAGVFVLVGWLARKHKVWAFVVGIVLYLADGLLFLVFSDWKSVAFHAFALLFIVVGLLALKKLPAPPSQVVPITVDSGPAPIVP